MKLIKDSKPVKVQLSRNLVKTIKQGHAWVYADALRQMPEVEPGTPAILLDNRGGREIAKGFLDPTGPIALRICTTNPGVSLNHTWAKMTMQQAIQQRKLLFSPFTDTNAYRLFNGEGDGLPGLVCDIYDHSAVVVTDGTAPDHFWQVDQIANLLQETLDITQVFYKSRSDHLNQTVPILGGSSEPLVFFKENNLTFTANLIEGQKTGFFLDQRDNRAAIQPYSSGKTVLNVFGYTGGFSVYAGKSGAEHVTTLDLAAPALKAACNHWEYNHLPVERHTTINSDAFKFLSQASQAQEQWEMVILDPPSFAPSEASVPQAETAYTRLISLGSRVTAPKGILAAASCSSHIHQQQFLKLIENGLSASRRSGILLGVYGQPNDHPAPLVMPELRYLKFVLLQLD
ncbi:MAG: class I SAM-dependent rRNA methyltransferase [Anaerolineales bacterium]